MSKLFKMIFLPDLLPYDLLALLRATTGASESGGLPPPLSEDCDELPAPAAASGLESPDVDMVLVEGTVQLSW